MAANDEFPRGWTQTSGGGAVGAASIVFPATAGLTWVLTSVYWDIYTTGAYTGPIIEYPTVTSNGVVLLTGYVWAPGTVVAGTNSDWTWSNAGGNGQIEGYVGKDLTINAPGQFPDVYALMNATAYSM